jgi:hypothetical protein
VPSCTAHIPLKDLISHLDSEHKTLPAEKCLKWLSPTATFYYCILSDNLKRNWIWNPQRLKYKDEHFFFQMSRNESGIWFAWVYFAGYPIKAEDFWCNITAFSVNDAQRSAVFSCDVIPMSVDLDIVQTMRNSTGLTLSDAMVEKIKERPEYDLLRTCLNVALGDSDAIFDKLHFKVTIGKH